MVRPLLGSGLSFDSVLMRCVVPRCPPRPADVLRSDWKETRAMDVTALESQPWDKGRCLKNSIVLSLVDSNFDYVLLYLLALCRYLLYFLLSNALSCKLIALIDFSADELPFP